MESVRQRGRCVFDGHELSRVPADDIQFEACHGLGVLGVGDVQERIGATLESPDERVGGKGRSHELCLYQTLGGRESLAPDDNDRGTRRLALVVSSVGRSESEPMYT